MPEPPPTVPECRNPFDRPFLELALAGRADALVSGNAGNAAWTALRERRADNTTLSLSRLRAPPYTSSRAAQKPIAPSPIAGSGTFIPHDFNFSNTSRQL